MLTFKRILFPVDFSDRTHRAAPHVESFAKQFQAEMIQLHVAPLPAVAYAPLEPGWTDLNDDELAVYKDSKEWPLEGTRLVVRGDPANTIVDIAAEKNADLIMMPTHGYGRFRRFVLGSVTAKVLHDAQCPVWTGTHMEAPAVPEDVNIRHVICAIDLDEKAMRALQWARAIADKWGADLRVVHAVPPIQAFPEMYPDVDFREQIVADARRRAGELMKQAGIASEMEVHEGEISKVLRDDSRRMGGDLMVISRSSPGVLGRLRTHSYAIVRDSPCPVLSV